MIRPLHVTESWRPVTSGYTSRSWELLNAQIQHPALNPKLIVSSRHLSYTNHPPDCGLLQLNTVRKSQAERLIHPVYPHYVDTGHLRKTIVASATNVDLIHSHWSSGIGRAARNAARNLQLPFVAEVRFDLAGAATSSIFHRSLPALNHLLRRHFESYIGSADHIIAASHTLADLLSSTFPNISNRLTVVPNGVNHDTFFEGESTNLRKHLQLEGKTIVGTTSNMLYYEGLEKLIDALDLLNDPSIHLLFVGSGMEYERLQKRANSSSANISFTGKVSPKEVGNYLRLMDIFTVPRFDNSVTRFASPIKVAEAMACGCPVIATNLGDITIMLADNRGIIIPTNDKNLLANSIKHLASDPTKCIEMGKRAASWARKNLSWSNAANLHHKIYENCL